MSISGSAPRRDDVRLTLDGRAFRLRLTFGALAELEAALDAPDLAGLGERLAAGRLATRDLIAILGAGLRGAGHDLSDDQVAALPLSGELPAVVSAVGDLMARAFGEG